jgi:hypothetical protein
LAGCEVSEEKQCFTKHIFIELSSTVSPQFMLFIISTISMLIHHTNRVMFHQTKIVPIAMRSSDEVLLQNYQLSSMLNIHINDG